MNTIPQTILLSQVDLGVRGRTKYDGIEDLAESIEQNGLIQPVVLVPTGKKTTQECGSGDPTDPTNVDWYDHDGQQFALIAGGRRFHALQLLGVTELHHGVTSEPGRYGFLLKGEAGTELTNLLTEIAENRDRADVPWQDEVKMIVRAAKLIRRDSFAKGHRILMRDMGSILGCGYQDFLAAETIYEDLLADPEGYASVTSARGAVQVLLKKNQQFLEAEQVKRSLTVSVQSGPRLPVENILSNGQVLLDSLPDLVPAPVTIPITQSVLRGNGIDWLFAHPSSVDHIICDPDFAIDREALACRSWSPDSSSDGVVQETVEQSLTDLRHFICASACALKSVGFLVFFCDLDHWEKIQQWIGDNGLSAQRWPIIWHKVDYRANSAPQCNTCKNMEYLVVARRRGTVFADGPQMSSIWPLPSAGAVKEYGHPFAKPHALWTKIYKMCCVRGQTTFDPFLGSGSSMIPALDFGLVPIGCEIQEQHYNTAMLNVQGWYRRKHGEGVLFT